MVFLASSQIQDRWRPFLATMLLSVSMMISCSAKAPDGNNPSANPDYVIAYPDMPVDGVRPVDINGIVDGSHAINSCALPFLRAQFKRLGLPILHLRKVRFHNSLTPVDTINDVAFSKGFRAITRVNDIYVGAPEMEHEAYQDGELIFFHELVHTAQYQSGELSLPAYAASSMNSFALGDGPHANGYETQADELAVRLLNSWRSSKSRKECYPDARLNPGVRRVGKRADVIVLYAAFDRRQGKYLPFSMQF